MSIISLEGLMSVGGNEDRSLALIDVQHNGNLYHWKIYIPHNIADLAQFLEDSKLKIEADIDNKELIWKELNPKTRIEIDGLTNEEIIIDIQKDEIVKPDIPDYYAKRRSEYPTIGEQLGALYKGINSIEYATVQQKINDIKIKYPKP